MTGPTSVWCAETARRLGCYVVAGYPELLAKDESRPLVDDEGTESVGANSATVYGPMGSMSWGIVRPTFLQRTKHGRNLVQGSQRSH